MTGTRRHRPGRSTTRHGRWLGSRRGTADASDAGKAGAMLDERSTSKPHIPVRMRICPDCGCLGMATTHHDAEGNTYFYINREGPTSALHAFRVAIHSRWRPGRCVSHERRSWQARQTIEAANQKSRTTRAIRDACQRLGARPPLKGSHFAIFQKQRPRHEGCAPGARHLHLAGRRRTRTYSQRQPCAVSNWYATHGRIIAHLEGDDLKHPLSARPMPRVVTRCLGSAVAGIDDTLGNTPRRRALGRWPCARATQTEAVTRRATLLAACWRRCN